MKKYFYKYCDSFVVLFALISLYAILQIKFDFAFWICYSAYAQIINEVIVNLSYSYLAAFVFYILTVWIPFKRMKYKVKIPLEKKINSIRSNYKACIDSVLPMSENPKDDVTREEVFMNFRAVSYKNACRFSFYGANESILDFICRNHQYIIHLSGELLEYKPWLSPDTIANLEEIRNSRLPGFIKMMSNSTFRRLEDEVRMREQLAGFVYGLWDLSKKVKP